MNPGLTSQLATDRRASLFAVWESGDITHPSYDWARDHHEPHFGLVEGAAAIHDELMRAFRAEVGPLDDQKAGLNLSPFRRDCAL